MTHPKHLSSGIKAERTDKNGGVGSLEPPHSPFPRRKGVRHFAVEAAAIAGEKRRAQVARWMDARLRRLCHPTPTKMKIKNSGSMNLERLEEEQKRRENSKQGVKLKISNHNFP